MPIIRPCQASDLAGITDIYAHHVLNGTGTFEIDTPSEQEMTARWAEVRAKNLPYLVAAEGAILICGRYEGIDQRFIDLYVDQQISLGDFVLSGGEIAAMALLDAVARLQPGVLNDAQSHQQDSFGSQLDGLLDCQHYTRPQSWGGTPVPQVLMSGKHAEIERWRREQSLALTAQLRPDLIRQARQSGRLGPLDEAFLAKQAQAKASVVQSSDQPQA